MLQTGENETEILLGNKQLLGIFLVVAVLLGISFTGGFLIGRGSLARKAPPLEATAAPAPESRAATASSGGQTHILEGETTLPAAAAGGADTEAAVPPTRVQSEAGSSTPRRADNGLGSRKGAKSPLTAAAVKADVEPEPRVDNDGGYTPRTGTTYLQVAAVSKDEAETVADVLHRKGFHAHAVPKPGNTKIYRVIIGPVKDAGDLSSTRDALRKTFREVIVQHY